MNGMNGNSDPANKVPLLDLVSPHRELEDELVAVFRAALATAGFIGGPMVEDFERSFAEYCDTRYCVGVASGTDALRFALMAAGMQSGDSVITVPNSFIATTEAISQAGAHPQFVDIDERTYNLDPNQLRHLLENECEIDATSGETVTRTERRRVVGVIPVHLYGQPADMDPILELAEHYKLTVIEDACQAHGAEYFSAKHGGWRKAGSMGRAAAFSFYPGKNLGACGEAGAVTTNDETLAAKVRMLRDHGQAKKYYHDVEGYNGRLDAIQAGILSVKLKHLEQWNSQRRERAAEYNRLLAESDCGLLPPYEPEWARAVYHLYVLRTQNREGLIAQLKEAGIGTGIHYPVPLHLQRAYRSQNYRSGNFPVAERVAAEIVSLPMFPTLTGQMQSRVIEKLGEFVRGKAASRAARRSADLEPSERIA